MENKRIVIIGGVAGGASCATKLRRLDEKTSIKVFEKGQHVSFSNCCLPYRLGNVVKNTESLILMNPQGFKKNNNIEVFCNHEVIKIKANNHTIIVRNTLNNTTFEEPFDKLIISTGSRPIIPNIKGLNIDSIFTIKNVEDISNLLKYLGSTSKTVNVIGGGFIGLETAENLAKAGHKVNIVEGANQILRTLDFDFAQIVEKELIDNNISLFLNKTVVEIHNNSVHLSDGSTLRGDAIIMCVGVTPESALFKDANIKLSSKGSILVNENYETNIPNIYAIGDVIEVKNGISKLPFQLMLAGPAQKQAYHVAKHIYNKDVNEETYIGSNCLKLFSLNIASTGLTENSIKSLGINYDYITIIPFDHVSLIPGASQMFLKVLFDSSNARILGAQAISKGDAVDKINVISSIIKFSGTLYDLRDLELCYSPIFSSPKDPLNYAGYVGCNVFEKTYKQVHVNDVRGLVENNEYILDVRENNEYEAGHLINSINIPLSQLRDRLNEIPNNKNIYVQCRSGQRSYYATMILKNNGFDNVFNISGGFLEICLYEYLLGQDQKRNPIVTKYNFH